MNRKLLSSKPSFVARLLLLSIAGLLLYLPSSLGHGYLKSPRSRNYVAYKSTWWPLNDDAPWPESDVQSLNTGGAAARCGKVSDRNYDSPKNNKGSALANQVQGTYEEGSLIDFYVVLSAPHGGHFVYKACPIEPGEVATQACFDNHPLQFVKDGFYGATPDESYPERAYLPPQDLPGIKTDSTDVPGKSYSHTYRLPPGLQGSNVLIQWHYITANSGCRHEGYDTYDWPPGFENQYLNKPCPPLSQSGGSFAEQFWNCAEVKITSSTFSSTTTTTTMATSSTVSSMAGTSSTGSTRKQVGETCSLSSECVSDSCFDSKCECRKDLECPNGEICSMVENTAKGYTFSCMSVSTSVGEECLLPAQCESGSCYNSKCECRIDSQCHNGEICENTRGTFLCTEEVLPRNPPTITPSSQPSIGPSLRPSLRPSASLQPSTSLQPSVTSPPSGPSSPSPSSKPSFEPSISAQPSREPSMSPSRQPSASLEPSLLPSNLPTVTTEPTSQPSPTAASPYKATVSAYYASWQWYDRNKIAAPLNFDYSKIDRINFAFFQANENGYLFGTDSWGDPNVLFGPIIHWTSDPNQPKYCSWDRASSKSCKHHKYDEGLISLAHAAGAQVYPSIGGWSLSDAFVEMAAKDESRKMFASQCKDLIIDYDFDGIDIDWEYPGYEAHSGTPDDRINFNLLLDEVRKVLDDLEADTGKHYGLTAALPCGPDHMDNLDIPHVNQVLDELNVMSYDFGGSWSATTSINAPMVYQGWGPEDFSVDDCVRNWVDEGGSRDKINLGLSFYGRSFAGATGLNEAHQGTDKAHWSADEGTPQYYNILAQLPNMISVRDDLTQSQYAYFQSGGLVSFDDERSICDKTEYVIENNLNGFLIWELSGDLLLDLETPLLDSINSKLKDPSLDCAMILSGSQSTSTSATGATVTNTAATTTSNGSSKNCHSHTQSCGPDKPCPNDTCCSDWGYCGSSIDFCGGDCCQNGPCHRFG